MHIYFSVFTDIPSVYRYPQVKPNPLYPIVGCLWESDTNFSRPVLSTFRPFTACSRPVYGNKFSTAKYIFIRPVLSYFAVATATWQHWKLILVYESSSVLNCCRVCHTADTAGAKINSKICCLIQARLFGPRRKKTTTCMEKKQTFSLNNVYQIIPFHFINSY
jgi:hypothetical protein